MDYTAERIRSQTLANELETKRAQEQSTTIDFTQNNQDVTNLPQFTWT